MDAASPCPKCGYARKATDTAPAWQCPSCHIAIEKFRAAMAQPPPGPASMTLDVVPPQLPFERRLGSAIPDLLMAGLFLWCWLKPGAWRPTLAADLGLLMLMEFFVVHASIFLAAGGSTGHRFSTATFVVLFYVPVAGAFAWWHGGWWPVFGFLALLGSRIATMLAGKGSDDFETRRGRYYWAQGAAMYIVFAMIALWWLPMPELGFKTSTTHVWQKFWLVRPYEVIAWGFFYFGGQAVLKLLEKPEWIFEPVATSEPAE